MDDETQPSTPESASAPESEGADAQAERTFAPLPSLRRGKRPFSLRRALIAAAGVVILIALVAGVAGAVTLVQQRQRREAIATANAANAATATAQASGQFPPRADITAISMDSPTDGWALENYQAGGQNPGPAQNVWYALHISHGVVSRQAMLPVNGFGPLPTLQALTPTDVWVLFSNGPVALYHYDGHTWTAVTLPLPAGATGQVQAEAFTMRSPSDGWAMASYGVNTSNSLGFAMLQAFYHYDGATWTQEQADSAATTDPYGGLVAGQGYSGQITGMAVTPTGDVWATGYMELMDSNSNITSSTGYLYHRAGGVWHVSTLPGQELYGIAMSGPDSGWIIGATVTLTQFGSNPPVTEVNQAILALSFDGATWSSVAIPAPSQEQTGVRLQQVAASGPSDVWITGQSNGTLFSPNSAVASNSDYLAHFDGSGWAPVPLPEVAAINPHHDASVVNQTSFQVIATGSANDLWIAGSLNTTDQAAQSYANRPLLFHSTSGQWVSVPLPKV